jgi:hypothetical protein
MMSAAWNGAAISPNLAETSISGWIDAAASEGGTMAFAD